MLVLHLEYKLDDLTGSSMEKKMDTQSGSL